MVVSEDYQFPVDKNPLTLSRRGLVFRLKLAQFQRIEPAWLNTLYSQEIAVHAEWCCRKEGSPPQTTLSTVVGMISTNHLLLEIPG